MKWLSKLFGGGKQAPEVGPTQSVRPAAKVLRPSPEMARPEASRISTETVRDWCAKLEKEADRTGNSRLRAQAANIRARLT